MILRPETRSWPGRLLLGCLFFAMSGTAWLPAQAAPVARFDDTVNGEFLIIGSTIGYDCGSGVAPPVLTTTDCGLGLFHADSAFDLVWLDNDGSPGAGASAARTSARLDLPEDATVVRAQLYWAGLAAGNGDSSVALDRDDGREVITVIADEVQELPGPGGQLVSTAYQATADVTDLVGGAGPGTYRVTDINARRLLVADADVFGGWVLVVIYQQPGAPARRISLHDGLSEVAPGSDAVGGVAGLTSLREPASALLAVWAFEGDLDESGDRVLVEGLPLDGSVVNPAANFFNGTRSLLGVPVPGLVPAVSGEAGTLAGVDIDLVDISEHISAAARDIDIVAVTTGDRFWLGGFVASLALAAPPPADAATGPEGGVEADGGPEADASTGGDGPGGEAGDAGAPDPSPADAGELGDVGDVGDGGSRAGSDRLNPPEDPADARRDGSNRTVLGGSGCACRAGGVELPTRTQGPGMLLILWLAAFLRRRL